MRTVSRSQYSISLVALDRLQKKKNQISTRSRRRCAGYILTRIPQRQSWRLPRRRAGSMLPLPMGAPLLQNLCRANERHISRRQALGGEDQTETPGARFLRWEPPLPSQLSCELHNFVEEVVHNSGSSKQYNPVGGLQHVTWARPSSLHVKLEQRAAKEPRNASQAMCCTNR